MRILAIDYGKKRTGIAVTDTLQIIAGGLDTVEKEVETIVVGYPRQMDGDDSENMKRITPFVNRLKKLFPQVNVEMYDERFTSVLAHKTMLDSGIGRKARQDKGLVDKISATIILQDYLEYKKLRI